MQVSAAKGNIDVALDKLPTDQELAAEPDMLQNIRKATYPILTQLRPVVLMPDVADQDDDIQPDDI